MSFADNNLKSTIKSVTAGAVNAEVNLELAGDTELHVIIASESVQELGLEAGMVATALIKASGVILGVPA
ncbi:TOBE domain-containing protein [Vulcanococcus limneticus Candia 3F8]|uniref:TOBE domain-containing protein n=1 Tax=Vulcanococcus limneticus TaxID=2170428 RepID=UPI0018E37228|nr:TOBE domain-containing protein [Vulcanococcus limneticus MW73D5]MCP9894842.1 TOBE domain-containing protein [Vulcanococcus limneticus Candia 3F8]MCP9898685.1 TOBE domain-containing protein [Vulcanococcus limneticus Candia 3B3]